MTVAAPTRRYILWPRLRGVAAFKFRVARSALCAFLSRAVASTSRAGFGFCGTTVMVTVVFPAQAVGQACLRSSLRLFVTAGCQLIERYASSWAAAVQI